MLLFVPAMFDFFIKLLALIEAFREDCSNFVPKSFLERSWLLLKLTLYLVADIYEGVLGLSVLLEY